MKHNYVPDGCFLLARQIFESAIWRDDPHVLKLFIYLMGKARHNIKPKKYPSFEIKRGELITSLAKIAEDNEYHQNSRLKIWARMKISRMLDLLEKQGYIKRLCDTYGTHISICNYNVYQDINNYKCDNGGTQVLQDCYTGVTEVLLNKKGNKDNKEKKEKNKDIYGEFKNIFLAGEEYQKLAIKYPGHHNDMIERMSQHIETKPKDPYKSHYAAILKNEDWLKKKTTTTGFKSRTEKNTEAKEEFLRNNNIQEKDITPEIKTLEAE